MVRRVLVASPDYLAHRGAPKTPAEIAEHEIIFGRTRPGPREWRFGRGRGAAIVRLAPRLTIHDVEGVLYAARAGRGLARLLTYQVAADLEAGRLVRILRDHEPPAVPVQLITASASHRPAKLRAFLDLALATFRALPVIHAERDEDA